MDTNQKELRYKAYIQERKTINQIRRQVIQNFVTEEYQFRHKKLHQKETQYEHCQKFEEQIVITRAKKNLRHLYQKVINQIKDVPFIDKELQQQKFEGLRKFNLHQIKDSQNQQSDEDDI